MSGGAIRVSDRSGALLALPRVLTTWILPFLPACCIGDHLDLDVQAGDAGQDGDDCAVDLQEEVLATIGSVLIRSLGIVAPRVLEVR